MAFADPSAAGKRSAEVRNAIGNSRWGRSLRQKQFRQYQTGRPKKQHYCANCQALIGSGSAIVQERLARYHTQQVVDDSE